MLEQLLQKIGFGKNDIKVYLSLCELGKIRAGDIIKHTGLHRNLVYTALDELEKKQFISKTLVNNIATFEANNPEAILQSIDEQKRLAEDAVLELKKIQTTKSRDIKVHEGYEGIIRARERMINAPKGETMYVFASSASSRPEYEKYWRDFHNRREQAGIKMKILYQRTDDPFIKSSIEWRKGLALSEAKYFPNNINAPLWMSVCKDMLDIGIISEQPITLSMNNEVAAEGFKQYFNSFWNQPVIVQTGVEALRQTIYGMLSELESGEEYCVLGAHAGIGAPEIEKLYGNFHEERIKKGVIVKMLAYGDSAKPIRKKFYESGDPFFKVSLVKTLSYSPQSPIQINVYKNKAFLIIYSNPVTVLLFDRPELNEGFKSYFDELWEISR